jgi:hypothetical protein
VQLDYGAYLENMWPLDPSLSNWKILPVVVDTSMAGLASSALASTDGTPIQWYRTFESVYNKYIAPSDPSLASQNYGIAGNLIVYACVSSDPGDPTAPSTPPVPSGGWGGGAPRAAEGQLRVGGSTPGGTEARALPAAARQARRAAACAGWQEGAAAL